MRINGLTIAFKRDRKMNKLFVFLMLVFAVNANAAQIPHKMIAAYTNSDVGLGNVTNDLQLKDADKDTDGTLAANSDAKIASQKAVKTYVDTSVAAAGSSAKENITLSGGDITNQYVDLAVVIKANSLEFTFNHVVMVEGSDYTLSTVLGKTRVTFAGDLATGGAYAAVAAEVLNFKYNP
jgi:hypothetical protein